MYTGSMVGSGAMAFALMPYAVANARPDEGCTVDLNPTVLSAVFGEPVKKVKQAIEYLCSADKDSRSPECDGKRLVLVGPGPFRYKVVNLEKYRADANSEERNEYWKQYRRWERDGRKGVFKFTVNNVNGSEQFNSVQSTDADADAVPDKKTRALPHPEHKAFIEGWCQNFRAAHGFDYVVAGAKDGKAVRELLMTGILRLDLLEIAKSAWDRNKKDGQWNCRQADTIHGFQSQLNQIRTELKNGTHTKANPAYPRTPEENVRNVGTYRTNTDYAAAVKRKSAEMVRQMASPKQPEQTGTPPVGSGGL